MRQSFLSAQNLSIGYKSKYQSQGSILYSNLNLELYSGELTCLLGANGAGKSTLLKTLNHSISPLSGEIFLQNKNIKSYSTIELSQKLGLVLTERIEVGGLLVKELVGLGRYPYTGFWGKNTHYDNEVIQKAMEAVRISHKADNYVAELSDGERQKAMIAKTLAQECPIILLDEPSAFLDATSRIEIIALLQQLAKDENKAILLSTHDIELAISMADRIWLLSKNKGFKYGIPEDLILSGNIDSYLGQENIKFDLDTGSFNGLQDYDRYIEVQTDHSHLKWVKNFITRMHFSLANTHTPLNKIIYRLCFTSSKEIILLDLRSNQEYNLSSFQELHSLLMSKEE